MCDAISCSAVFYSLRGFFVCFFFCLFCFKSVFFGRGRGWEDVLYFLSKEVTIAEIGFGWEDVLYFLSKEVTIAEIGFGLKYSF